MNDLLKRFEIESVEMITVEVAECSVESEDYLQWLLESGVNASMGNDDCGSVNVSCDFVEDENYTLGTALWEAYCNS